MDPRRAAEARGRGGATRRALLRRLGLGGVLLFVAALAALLARMLFPRTRLEGPRYLRAGRPEDLEPGTVSERFLASHRLWLVRDAGGLYALFARCTHLGCTPVWVASARKFRCPCHGSGFALDGTNLEGRAPTPLERFRLFRDADGTLVIDLGTRLRKRRAGSWSGPGARLALGPGRA